MAIRTIFENNYSILITLIGMSASGMGQSQSLNTFCKKSTYLESMSLRNRLLTYWSKTTKTVDYCVTVAQHSNEYCAYIADYVRILLDMSCQILTSLMFNILSVKFSGIWIRAPSDSE